MGINSTAIKQTGRADTYLDIYVTPKTEAHQIRNQFTIEPTPMQRNIEMLVTNGIGYDSQTSYFNRDKKLGVYANDSTMHGVHEGLMVHLAELDAKTYQKGVSLKLVESIKKEETSKIEKGLTDYFYLKAGIKPDTKNIGMSLFWGPNWTWRENRDNLLKESRYKN